MIQISKKALEERREAWATVAKNHNWYKEPFFVTIWVAPDGSIMESLHVLAEHQPTHDIIKSYINDCELKPDQYEII